MKIEFLSLKGDDGSGAPLLWSPIHLSPSTHAFATVATWLPAAQLFHQAIITSSVAW